MWEYDGVDWVERTAVIAAPRPFAGEMVFDAAHGSVVMFGGIGAPRDLWAWDGAQWTRHSSPTGPRSRFDPGLAYDLARRKLVLFGGALDNLLAELNDMWEWDGDAWTNRAPRVLARQSGAVVYDPFFEKIVLFGGDQFVEASPGTGAGAGVGLLNDTWQWDGTQWLAVASPSDYPTEPSTPPPEAPPPRMGCCCSAARCRTGTRSTTPGLGTPRIAGRA